MDTGLSHLHFLVQHNGGVFMAPWGKSEQWTISPMHTDADVDRFCDNVERFAALVAFVCRRPLARVRRRRVLPEPVAMTPSQLIPTLTGREYSSDEVYEREREHIFHRSWFYVAATIASSPGDRFVADVAGESVLVVKDRDGQLHAHANVCRHRGAQLCEESGPGSKAGITCPYHAWTYSLDGRLIGTPHLAADEVDRGSLSLWSVACEVWHGFVFVNLSADPMPLLDWFAAGMDSVAAVRTSSPR